MAGQDRRGAIDLLKQHHAHQLMRPGRGAEGDLNFGALAQTWRDPIRAADDETSRRTVFRPPIVQQAGETCAVDIVAAFIHERDRRSFRNDVGDGDRFFGAPPFGVLRAALTDFDNLDVAKAKAAAGCLGALAIGRGEFAFGALFQAADGGDEETRRLPDSNRRISIGAGERSRWGNMPLIK